MPFDSACFTVKEDVLITEFAFADRRGYFNIAIRTLAKVKTLKS
jgi:hypothetical protein